MQYLMGLIGNLLLTISIVFAGWQFHKESQRKKVEKAVELSKFFVDEIIPGCLPIVDTYKSMDLIKEIEHNIKIENVKCFDKQELSRLNPTFVQKWDKANKQLLANADGIKIGTLLNNFEYFSMQLTSNVADEESVYQSLHQVFLLTIKLMYSLIASQNENNNNKYYTNIIKLFCIWEDRHKKHVLEEQNTKTGLHKQPKI